MLDSQSMAPLAAKFSRDKNLVVAIRASGHSGRGSAVATTVWSELGPLFHLQKSLLSVTNRRDGLQN